jgi:hypothetical protein
MNFSEQIAVGIVRKRLRMRDKFNAMLAQCLNRQFLFDLIAKGA